VSRVQIATVAGAAIVAAALLAFRGLRPASPSIAALRARYFGISRDAGAAPASGSLRQRWSRSLAASELGLRLETRFGTDLRASGLTVPDVISRTLAAAVVAAMAAMAANGGLVVSGAVTPSPLLLALIPIAAVIGAVSVAADLRGRSRTARASLRQAAADFVQLVAVSLTTSRSVEESIDFASRAGDGAGFDVIRHAVASAPQMGVTTWEALDVVGHTYDVPELRDLAASIERQASVGASVEQTVSTLAASMRAKALDELERAADRANSNLSGPTIGFVVGMVLLLAYPLAVRVTAAFQP
jgi:Flp pilus assembly protein TadB